MPSWHQPLTGNLTTQCFLCRRFRAYNRLPGAPLRLAAGSDGALWLTVSGEGVYRGYAYNPEQPTKPTLSTTCTDIDALCADGGCNSALTTCVRCAADAMMGADGQVRRQALAGTRVHNAAAKQCASSAC